MESKDIIRLQRDLTTNALSLMGEGDKQRYDGLSEGYRRWEKSIVNTFNSIGLNHLERFFKHPNVKQIGKTNVALWRNAFCLSDRRLIHNVVLGTITAEAALAADDDSHNGVLLIAYFYEQWGSPSLPNTITALRELLNTKVEYNDNPAPAFKNVERIMRDFFPESGDNIKIALVFMVLNEAKYRPVLDVYQEIRASDQKIPTYDELMLTKPLSPSQIVSLRRELRAWGGVCSTLDYSTRELQAATFRRSASYLGKRDHPSSSKTTATTAKQPALKKLDPGSK